MDWLWQGLLTNGLYALLIIGAGTLVAVLRLRASHWLQPALYGLAGSALVAVILASVAFMRAIPARSPNITPMNIEAHLHAWADKFGLGMQRQPSDATAYFVYAVALHSGTHVMVTRTKDREEYIQFLAQLAMSPEHAAAIKKLSKKHADLLTQRMALELSRADVGFTLIGSPDAPLAAIAITKIVAVTNQLTEGAFAEYLDKVDRAVLVARATVVLELARGASH